MAKLLRTSFLQVIDIKIKDKKKFKIIINIAIFLSFFAVTSSIITIFYENKINKIKDEILSTQRMIYIFEATQTHLPFKLMLSSKHLDDLKRRETLMNLNVYSGISVFNESSRQMYYFPFTEIKSHAINFFELFEELFKITNHLISTGKESEEQTKEQLVDKYLYLFTQHQDLVKKKEEFTKIINEVDEDLKKYGKKEIDFPDNYYHKYANFYFIAEENINLLTNFIRDCLGILNQEMSNEEKNVLKLTKEISILSNKSSNTILIAFFIQLIIFLIIQYMEVATTREQNEKR